MEGSRRRGADARREPVQEFFSIGDVCTLTDLKPHVLRYWETQFKVLSPAKNRSGNRVYARREVELILFVKHLLYTEKYTIDGARQQLDAQRKGGSLRSAARASLARETVDSIERELRAIVDVLEGRVPLAPPPAPDPSGPNVGMLSDPVAESASATETPTR